MSSPFESVINGKCTSFFNLGYPRFTIQELHDAILTLGHRMASLRERPHGFLDAFLHSHWLQYGTPNGYRPSSVRFPRARSRWTKSKGDILIPNREIVLIPAESDLQVMILGDEFQDFDFQSVLA